jgi:putative ubiquitin-RnfH superfamily antitoxin RatB of RatAB toxin-antitoxin module
MGDVPDCDLPACLVAVDTPAGPWLCELPLAPGMSVARALAEARARAGTGVLQGIDWDSGRVGIWGQRCARERQLAPGDRVELYLPLPGDPRERRRAQAGRQRAALRRRGP